MRCSSWPDAAFAVSWRCSAGRSRRATSAPSPSKPPLVLATLNRAKGAELIALLAEMPFAPRLLAEWPGAVLPEEIGDSYAANALAKARAGLRLTGALTLGDDSGLEVDALDGAPGLHSARFGGPGLDDAGRGRVLLEAMRGVDAPRRTARFRTVIALASPEGDERLVEGAAEGVILTEPRGRGGFGYDPLFYYPPLGRTFAELSEADKARVSARGLAAQAVRRLLTECYTRRADA